jgi:hypothetical protein
MHQNCHQQLGHNLATLRPWLVSNSRISADVMQTTYPAAHLLALQRYYLYAAAAVGDEIAL